MLCNGPEQLQSSMGCCLFLCTQLTENTTCLVPCLCYIFFTSKMRSYSVFTYLVIRSNAFNLQNYSPVSTLLNSVWYLNHAVNSRCIKSEVNDRVNLPGRKLVCWQTICFEWPIKHCIIIYLWVLEKCSELMHE